MLTFAQGYPASWVSQVALVVKNPPANAGDVRDAGLISGSGRSPGEGHGNHLQYSCLKSPHGQRSGGLQSLGADRVRHDCSDSMLTHTRLVMEPWFLPEMFQCEFCTSSVSLHVLQCLVHWSLS